MPTDVPADSPGARLRALRVAAGLTQQDLADKLGITKARVSDAERNRKLLSLDWLYDVAMRMKWDPHRLDPRLASDRGTPR